MKPSSRKVWVLAVLQCFSSASANELPVLTLNADGHTDLVRRTLFSPDARRCYTLSQDRSVRVWDLVSGGCCDVYRVPAGAGEKGIITDGALSADGTLLALSCLGTAVDAPGAVHLLDAETGSILNTFWGHRKLVASVAISPDKSLLASGGDDLEVRFHPLDGREPWSLPGHAGKIRALAFSPDGRLLASGSYDHTVRLWDVAERRLVADLKEHTGQVRCIAWSPDGALLASGGGDRRVCLWRATGERVFASPALQNTVSAIDFAGPNRLVWGFGEAFDKMFDCVVFDLTLGRESLRFPRHDNTLMALSASRDGSLIASAGGNNHDTFIWETATGRVRHHLAGSSKPKYVVGWAPDGTSVAWGETRNAGLQELPSLPLQQAFNPSTLELGRPKESQERHIRGRHRNERLGLEWADERTLNVVAGGGPIGALKVYFDQPGLREAFTGWSLLDDRTAVAGTTHGLYRYDLTSRRIGRNYVGHSSGVYAIAPSPDGRHFATGSTDQTVRIWRHDRETPLLSIFTAGREWIAWTPEGYYAASPGGERLVGWLVNDGDRTPAFHPAERFYKQFFRPEAIKRLLEVGDIHQAVAMTSGGDPAGPRTIQGALPPKVAITAPAGTVEVGDERLRITAKATGDAPVTSLKVFVNGRPHLGTGAERKFSGKTEVAASWSIDLPPGRNTVAVMAANGTSHATSEPIVAVRRGAGGEAGARLFVLAAGVSKYESDAIGRLFYSAAGAKGVAEAFKARSQPAPYESVELKELVDADANRKNMLAALSDMEARMRPTDFAVIYYSGHGDRTKKGFCLLPCDADPAKLDETAISGEELKRALAALKGQVLLVLDACHSGEVIKDLSRDMGREENGLNVLCSSFDAQKSLENNELRQGPFTIALLECLEGKRKRAADGVVYFHHLVSEVPDRVDELTQGVQQVTAQVAPNRPRFPLSKPGN